MKPELTPEKVLQRVVEIIGEPVEKAVLAVEGIDHVIYIITTKSGKQVVVKTGENADGDAYVLATLNERGFKVPHLITSTTYREGERAYPLVIMSHVEGIHLQDSDDQSLYIPQLLDELDRIHEVESPGGAGWAVKVANGRNLSWKEFLLNHLTGKSPSFDWDKVKSHPLVPAELFDQWLSDACQKVTMIEDTLPIRLIHTDLNGANIFVKDGDITGIIDWSDAKFGDPLFDYARLRMYIAMYADQKTLLAYETELKKREKNTEREKTYYQINLLEYANWYTQYDNPERLEKVISLLKSLD